MDVCAIPGSVMIAMQDNTFLYTFGWNHKVTLNSNRVLIELNKGDMILFRGDLVYKPVGYSHKNVCLHGVLRPPEYEQAPQHHPHVVTLVDDTIVQQDPFCFVWRCQFRGNDLTSVRKHMNRFHHIRFRNHRRSIRANPRSIA
ncbi:hypothetical protein PHMEG_00020378 [Phytophthora megakarya]|uniref:Uncharacterized protein n=1 Tax=Phytophthora megakarya TaxID=4795 RepID=A0A225VQS7_9STRA|nr:hypothetical protein PHMEG_00020378 [Phytophthora megakarya]